ncbi:MAG: GNAT family N-acetyltransferase [Anaerolineae bacterium]
MRPARVEDMPRVGEILVEGFIRKFGAIFGRRVDRAPRVVAQIERLMLERGLCALFVAEMGGQVVGLLELTARRERLSDLWGQLQIMLREVGPVYTLRATVGLVLLHEETVVGTTAYISNIAVAAGFRRRGIGWRLLESAEEWARARGRRSLSLHVAASNPARHLYERSGFRLEKRSEEWLTGWLFGIRTWLYVVKPLSG